MSRRKGITFVHLSHLVFVENAHPEERSFTDLVGGPLIYSSCEPLGLPVSYHPCSMGCTGQFPIQKQSRSSPALGHSTTAIAL